MRPLVLHYYKMVAPQVKPLIQDKNSYEQWGLIFRNRLGMAAGFDKDASLLEFSYGLGLGYSVIGTVLPRPHQGNCTLSGHCPWMSFPHSQSAVNSLGLPHPGVEKVVENLKKFRESNPVKNFPLIASIMAHPQTSENQQKKAELLLMMEKLSPWVDGFEVNESCPNVSHNNDAQEILQRLETLCAHKKRPLWVKLDACPEENFLSELSKYCDAINLVNTQKKVFKLPHPRENSDLQWYQKNISGGVSGKALREYAHGEFIKAQDLKEKKQSSIELIQTGGVSIEDLQNTSGLLQIYTRLFHAFLGC